jgi:serine/threonine protein kinase
VGTLRYAPPEQLRGGPITPRTDLYAAGLVLYEMVAGGGPFDEETTDKGIARAHLEKDPPALGDRARVPPELHALVMSALSKDPEARPKDAFTFAARLRELAAAQPRSTETALSGMAAQQSPTSASNERTATTGAGVRARSGRRMHAAVGIVVAVVAVAGVWLAVRWLERPRATQSLGAPAPR